MARETGLGAGDCGLWSIRHDASGNPALSYSVPLILPDGRVYGVLGVELLPGFLASQMPTGELDEKGVYDLLKVEQSDKDAAPAQGSLYMVNDRSGTFRTGDTVTLSQSTYGGWTVHQGGTDYNVSLSPLTLYNRNAPFENQRWYVLGAVPSGRLFAFASQVKLMLLITVMLMLAFGIYGSLYASWHISKPITALRRELEASWDQGVPHPSATGITEVDEFARQITDLSRDVVNSSRRFLSIMEMSSIDIQGYELDEENGFLFVTRNFFRLFGREDILTEGMTPGRFRQLMDEIRCQSDPEEATGGGFVCAVGQERGTRYVHIQETLVETRRIGVAEDVTVQVLERKRIEHERDYDLLTGIFNRRAFYRNGDQLLGDREQLGIAVAVMIDLDNLKAMNDTYGHEWGDRYIMAGAQCIQEHVPEHALISRVSGDEFSLLFYGFQTKEQARQAVEKLSQGFRDSCFILPDGQQRSVGASGGFCFVEESAWDLKELMKHADFAMYTVKHTTKGAFGEFDAQAYQESELHQKKVRAFKRVLQEAKVRYVYQPIVDARTGALFACEALLRVLDGDIANTEEFLRIARQENALDAIEHLTWHNALAGFRQLIETGAVPGKTKIFINSQVSRLLNPEEQQALINQFGSIRENTVMEIVETDDAPARLNQLQSTDGELFAQEFALDDFGTGYNSDKNLLELMPRYLKLDMALVRNVHKHADQQLLIKGLITFAHEQNMLVLAEGVETTQELRCLLDMEVDLLQGFLLARPREIPGEINPQAVKLIRSLSHHRVS